jgi:subtilisin family serine protease
VVAGVLIGAAPAAAITPNDPLWNLASAMREIDMPTAWDMTTGNPNVIIATIDTGVDASVPDLQGALVPGWNFVDNNGLTDDHQGHGTVVASVIVARGNNGQAITGYCWQCRLMPMKASDTGVDFDPAKTAASIFWAVDHGARIISISISDEGVYATGDPQVASAIAYAANHNVLVVASAGNTGKTGLTFPGADPGAYPIAGTDPGDVLYPWSTYGSWIHIAAPGCQLALTPDSWYGPVCGNSMTAPAIAGIAGLMLSINPALTPAQIESALERTAHPVAGIVNGRVNAPAALEAVGGHLPTPPPAPPPPPPAATQKLRPVKRLKMATRIRHGLLGRHGQAIVRVRTGRISAVLQSPKAKSCTLSLRSRDTIWASTRRQASKRSKVVTLSVAAKVGAGRYTLDMWCSVRRYRRYSLVVRAFFAS